jgi:hypothetical protein
MAKKAVAEGPVWLVDCEGCAQPVKLDAKPKKRHTSLCGSCIMEPSRAHLLTEEQRSALVIRNKRAGQLMIGPLT